MTHKKLHKAAALLLALLLATAALPMTATAATLPEITWSYVQSYENMAKLVFTTPADMVSRIDSYEFRGEESDWMPIADGRGGIVPLLTGGWVMLRYEYNGQYSAIFRAYASFGKSYVSTDIVSGLSMLYHDSSLFPENATLVANTVTSGDSYESVRKSVLTTQKFFLYDIYFLDGNSARFTPGSGALLRIPLGGKMQRGYCEVYYVDEAYHRVLALEVTYDYRNVVFRSSGAGLYYIVSSWDGVSPPADGYEAPRPGTSVTFNGVPYILGDANMDGKVQADDARLALRACVKLEKLTGTAATAADADWDGLLTAADARLILRASVGLFD